MRLEMTCPCGGTFDADDSTDGSWSHGSLQREADQWREAHAACLHPLAVVREGTLPPPRWDEDGATGVAEPSR